MPGQRPVIFGEVLYDCYPDRRRVLGGAPFNVAWHLAGFGLRPWLVSAVGNDPAGDSIRRAMIAWGLDDGGVATVSGRPTGNVQVRYEDGEPRYEIAPDQAWDRIGAATGIPHGSVALVYHGTLAMRAAPGRAALAALIDQLAAPVFVDVNLRPPWWRRETAVEALDRARWVKLNSDELRLLSGGSDLENGARRLIRRHRLALAIVTRGADGAMAVDDGGASYHVGPPSAVACRDPVGAGDAFCAVVIAGLLGGWPTGVCLERAQSFATAIVAIAGATTTDRELYATQCRSWRNF